MDQEHAPLVRYTVSSRISFDAEGNSIRDEIADKKIEELQIHAGREFGTVTLERGITAWQNSADGHDRMERSASFVIVTRKTDAAIAKLKNFVPYVCSQLNLAAVLLVEEPLSNALYIDRNGLGTSL